MVTQTGASTVNVSAQGGVRFVTGSNTVTDIEGDEAGWSVTSTRAAKTNVDPVDPQTVLEGVDSLETWEYRGDDGEGMGRTHIGPMAEQFHDAFDVGGSEATINSVDRNGVALAAIQGLVAAQTETDERIADLEETVASLRAVTDALSETVAAKEARIAELAG